MYTRNATYTDKGTKEKFYFSSEETITKSSDRIFLYEKDNHLGSVRVVVSDRKIWTDLNANNTPDPGEIQAHVLQAVDRYPGGQPIPGRSFYGTGSQRFGYQGSEMDKEIASVGERHFTTFYREGDTYTNTWWSPDPKANEQPWQSPYNYMGGNPIWFNDPMGDEDNDYNVDESGKVVNIVENDQPNRFFDQNGNELKFNDPKGVDQPRLDENLQIGDRVFFNVSTEKFSDALSNAGIEPLMSKLKGWGVQARISTALSSHGKADFTLSFLSKQYPIRNDAQGNDGVFRSGPSEDAGYFRFQGSNKIYNLYDAGNYTWGAWMKINNYSEVETKFGAHMNEVFHGNLKGDTDADQRAIKEGFNAVTK